MIEFLLEFMYIFIIGAGAGWLIEVVYRRYLGKARRWINPGFLSGPYLPLYGTGVVILYIVSNLEVYIGLKVFMFACITTIIEYVTGLFFLKYYKIRLWDYTELKYNIQGIISPLYSIFWTLLSLIFYFIIYPHLSSQVNFISRNLELALFIGIFYGVVIVDMIYAFNLLHRLKHMVESVSDSKIAINYERLKEEILERFEDFSEDVSERMEELTDKMESVGERVEKVKQVKIRRIKPSFLLPFRGDYSLKQEVKLHLDKIKEERRILTKHRK